MKPHPTPIWHALQAEQLLAELGADRERGLSAAAVHERQQRLGTNALPEAPPRPLWRTLLRQLRSPLVAILGLAALLALALGHHADALVIVAVVAINSLLGAFQEGRAERSMAALRRLAALQVRVLRGRSEQLIAAHELVPGDLLLLATGDAVAADARLIEAAQLQSAEAALTGESVPVTKNAATLPEACALADRHNMVYAGTQIASGRGRAVVVAIATQTEVGRIARLTQQAEEPATPLERRLASFGRALVAAALGLFVLVLLLGLWRQIPLPQLLMVAISQIVSMVPEGLPVAMTIALAVGMQRMAARGAIIRRLAAVETLGSTTVICSDKTGTLTRNEMTAQRLWLPAHGDAGRWLQVEGQGYAPQGRLLEQGQPVTNDAGLTRLLEAAALCNDAALLPPEDDRAAWGLLGDPTEAALLALAAKGGVDIEALRRALPRSAELPFDADAKLMASWHEGRVCIKGAPEALLRLCDGNNATVQQAAQQAASRMAGDALRVLAFAELDTADPAQGFAGLRVARLLGLVGQIDPPRDEARAAVADCARAGVRTLMVTGDHKLTGLAIARQLGIAGPEDRAVDGEELERLGEAELHAALPGIAVFARVQPAQKLRIVEALQAQGEVVAMTGDGVNDAPALARADVGVAMGRSGTEVAKSAAKIVLADDNFSTLAQAIEQGRVVYANLKKVILYLLATSMAELLLLLLALIGGFPLPLAAVQILWINIVTEGTVTVNLVMEPPDGGEMRRPPLAHDERLLDATMLRRIALMTPAIALASFVWFWARLEAGVPEALVRTETFTLLAACQWFNVLNCRSATRSALRLDLLRNPWLAGGLLISVALQAAVLYVPVLNRWFHTQPLPAGTLLALLAVASSVLWVEEARKLLARRRSPP